MARSVEVAGLDLHAWLAHMSDLPVLGGRLVHNPCALHIRRASAAPKRRLAFASYDRHLIHLTDYPGIAPANALETLLHEVVHLSGLELRAHDEAFKSTLAQAAFECFGVDVRAFTGDAVYRLDLRIVNALADRDFPARPPSGTSP